MEIERIHHYKEKLIKTNYIYIEMSKINLSQSKYLIILSSKWEKIKLA